MKKSTPQNTVNLDEAMAEVSRISTSLAHSIQQYAASQENTSEHHSEPSHQLSTPPAAMYRDMFHDLMKHHAVPVDENNNVNFFEMTKHFGHLVISAFKEDGKHSDDNKVYSLASVVLVHYNLFVIDELLFQEYFYNSAITSSSLALWLLDQDALPETVEQYIKLITKQHPERQNSFYTYAVELAVRTDLILASHEALQELEDAPWSRNAPIFRTALINNISEERTAALYELFFDRLTTYHTDKSHNEMWLRASEEHTRQQNRQRSAYSTPE